MTLRQMTRAAVGPELEPERAAIGYGKSVGAGTGMIVCHRRAGRGCGRNEIADLASLEHGQVGMDY